MLKLLVESKGVEWTYKKGIEAYVSKSKVYGMDDLYIYVEPIEYEDDEEEFYFKDTTYKTLEEAKQVAESYVRNSIIKWFESIADLKQVCIKCRGTGTYTHFAYNRMEGEDLPCNRCNAKGFLNVSKIKLIESLKNE